MSHSHGKVIVEGNTIGYIEWNGTGDRIADNTIRYSIEEVNEHWRKSEEYFCSCPDNRSHMAAGIFPYVDDARTWHFGTVCLECMAVVEYLEGPGGKYLDWYEDIRCS